MKARVLGGIAGLSMLAAGMAQAGVHREHDRYERKRVQAGELISRTLGCREGQLTGGGFLILGQPEDRVIYGVTASFPLSDGRWRVDLRNVSGETQELNMVIYVLCAR